jgi:hypothetical protein
MVKRVKNQLIINEPTPQEPAQMHAPPAQLAVGTAPQHDSLSSHRTSLPTSRLFCDGHGIALIFGKFVDMYQELRSLDTDTAKLTARR